MSMEVRSDLDILQDNLLGDLLHFDSVEFGGLLHQHMPHQYSTSASSSSTVGVSTVEVVARTALPPCAATEPQQQGGSSQCNAVKFALSNSTASQPCNKRLYNGSSNSSSVPSAAEEQKIFATIFSFVGGGEHLYIAGVSRKWRAFYIFEEGEELVTRYSSALVSDSRLALALASGLVASKLDFSKWSHAALLCKSSREPVPVLARLWLFNVRWGSALWRNAAMLGLLPLLQWLHTRSLGRCHDVRVLNNASMSGSVPLLDWLLTVTNRWSEQTLQYMLEYAGWCSKLAAAQWLREQGAQWPHAFSGEIIDGATGSATRRCWSLPALQWAIKSDSGWRAWQCQHFEASMYNSAEGRQSAAAVLEWAHANGCPCTCG
jgi:hypothetical protein